jgi:hypothetical protein
MNGASVDFVVREDGKAATATYKPQPVGQYWRYPRDLPPLNTISARQMLTDSTVQLGLAARRAPILSCQFAYRDGEKWVDGVRATSPEVGDFVHRQLQRIWKRGLAQLIDVAQVWGRAAAEVTHRANRKGQIEVDELLNREPVDVLAILTDGKVSGVRFNRVVGAENGRVDLEFPYCMWHGHDKQPGNPAYGRSVLVAPYSPWWDKHMKFGALDVRRLFMTKDGYRGMRLFYPSGTTSEVQPDGSVKERPNYEIAMELVEHLKTGGVFAIPGDCDQNGNPLWRLEESTVPGNPAHILQYPKELDAEILNAMGIADDVLKSEATGSWAGKAVPQQATYCILEQWLCDLICDVDRVIEKLVEWNFGKGHQYEITTKPLAEQMLEQQNQGEQQQPNGPSGYGDPSGMDQIRQRMPPDRQQPQQQPPQRMSADPIGDVGADLLPAKDFVDAVRSVVRMSTIDAVGNLHSEADGKFVSQGGGEPASKKKTKQEIKAEKQQQAKVIGQAKHEARQSFASDIEADKRFMPPGKYEVPLSHLAKHALSLTGWDDEASPELSPDDLKYLDPIFISHVRPEIVSEESSKGTPKAYIRDGSHRTMGLLRWAKENGIDPSDVMVPIVNVDRKSIWSRIYATDDQDDQENVQAAMDEADELATKAERAAAKAASATRKSLKAANN